jgi:hypothetical protein
MSKPFTGFNRNEKVLILENRLLEFERRFKEMNAKGVEVPEHIYRDFCHNRTAYLEAIEEVVAESTWWVGSIDVFTRIGGKE